MVIVQMGEQLIGHPSTAIGELVKNGYDADATACYVYIHADADVQKTFLIIMDNGLGMDSSMLFGDWLRPSISAKRAASSEEAERKSEVFERKFLGSKGIGRLAAMALGRYVTVVTKKKKDSAYHWLKLDRESFQSDAPVTQVTFPGGDLVGKPSSLFAVDEPFTSNNPNPEVNPVLVDFLGHPRFDAFQEGTLIIVEEVDESIRAIMDDEREDTTLEVEDTTLVQSLRELITPLALNRLVQNELIDLGIITKEVKIAKEQSTFEVYYGTNDYLNELGDGLFAEVEPVAILHKYDYRVVGKVEMDASVSGYFFCRRLGGEFDFEEPFELASSYVLQDDARDFTRRKKRESMPADLEDAKMGTFFFDIRVYDRDTDALEKMGSELGNVSAPGQAKKIARMALDRYLGIRVSKNGFGVKPYGEEQKDWLGINQLRVQDPAHVIGVNQLLGNAFLYSPQNDGLSEKTNREGFFENKAFITFKKALRGILSKIGQKRYNFRVHYNIGRPIPVIEKGPDFNGYLNFIESKTEDTEIRNQTKKFVKDTVTALENMQTSLTFSQRLASIGSGLELVYHELAQPLSLMGGSHFLLERKAKRLPDAELKKQFLDDTTSMKESITALDRLKDSLQPAIGKSSPTAFKPYETFQKICRLFKHDLDRMSIQVMHDPAAEDYEIIDYEYVFWISFLNIVNNAVYWLGQTEGTRRIEFSQEQNVITISNTSPLIKTGQLENIFEYGVSHKSEKNPTGLGLSFTRSMLATNGWGIKAENTKTGPSFSITKIQENNE